MFPENGLAEDLAPDVAPLAAALDDLAARERARVPAGLSGRVYRAILADRRDRAEAPVVYAFPVARPSRSGRGLAMAATLGLLATVSAVWLAGQGPTPTIDTGPAIATEADLETLLTLASLTEPTTTQTDAFNELAADADAVARAVGESWMPDDLLYSDQSAEGSL